MSSPAVVDLCTQLHLYLNASPDALPLEDLLARVDAFVLECSSTTASESSALLSQLEDELQQIYHEVLGHSLLPHAEVFLAFLFRLKPVLHARSIISTWFDLVLRPALREPKLSLLAISHAKLLILNALDPNSNFMGADGDAAEIEKQKERMGDFRRRLMDLYLLDAFNESSGDDALEWAELEQSQREQKACWKANLEDVLVSVGLERPADFLTELYHCFASPTSRLQLLILLNAYTSRPEFPDHARALAQHPLTNSLLYSLIFDDSSTTCTIALTIFSKLLPIFAVKACEDLKRLLPQLLLVLARVLCWKGRQPSSAVPNPPQAQDTDGEDITDEEKSNHEDSRPLTIREDLEWSHLKLTFDDAVSHAPSPHRYFTFLYYIFPCNTIRFMRYPVRYLNDSGLESLFTVNWEDALDEDKIRSTSERLLRMHVLHPLLIRREAQEELEQPDFWAQYDVSQIVSGATMLDVRNAGLGFHSQNTNDGSSSNLSPSGQLMTERSRPRHTLPVERPEASDDEATQAAADAAPLSSSADTAQSTGDPPIPLAPIPLKVSLADMVATSVALRSGLNVEVVDAPSSWSTTLFPHAGTRSPSRSRREPSQSGVESTGTEAEVGTVLVAPEREGLSDDALPPHVAQAISGLQREVLLLKNDLNLELWTARENVRHIGRLYEERVLSRNEEVERQSLHSKLKEYKHMVTRLRRELKEEKSQAVTQRARYTDWNKELQDRLTSLRNEKKTWTSEAAAMRATEKEARDTFAAQGTLLANATQSVFRLETKIKEMGHKVDRLHDYETQIDHLMKLQRLWESDVQKLNESKDTLAAFASKYRKMELRLESHEKMQVELDTHITAQQQQIMVLQSKLEHYKKQLETSRRGSIYQKETERPAEWRRTLEMNENLRNENEDLLDEIEEVKAMVEVLKQQMSGRTGLVNSPSQSPRLSPSLSPKTSSPLQ